MIRSMLLIKWNQSYCKLSGLAKGIAAATAVTFFLGFDIDLIKSVRSYKEDIQILVRFSGP